MLDPLPVCLAIDIEPEARLLRRRHPEPLVGFEKLMHLVDPIRDHLGELTGAPAGLTWMLRMDPQIDAVYGSPSALAERYDAELASLRAAGDEIGIHQHMWRWHDQWVADHGDPDWVAHCVDVGLRAYEDAFGMPCRVFSFGDGFMSTAAARQLDDQGVEIHLSLEPGIRAVRKDVPTEQATGWRPDTRLIPNHAYRPARDDFRTADLDRTDGLVILPRTAGVQLARQVRGDQMVLSGHYETLQLWTAPEQFRDQLRARLGAPDLTHLNFEARTDLVFLTDDYAAFELNMVAICEELGSRARWQPASDVRARVEPLIAPAAAAMRERIAAGGAGRWLLGTRDPGFREGIEAEDVDLGSLAVADPPRPTLDQHVTVIIPVFNGGAHVRRAIESVIAQTAPPDELLIVDDGSPEDCLDFVIGLAAPFPIRVERRANAGQSAARNAGAEMASGGVLAFLDQDDHWHRDHLARLVPLLRDDPSVGWAYCDFDEIDGEGDLVTRSYLHHRGLEHPKTTLPACVAEDLMVVPSASVIRKQAFDEIGGFDESLRGYEDDDLYVRMFKSGWRFAFDPRSLTSFRVHATSHSANSGFAESRIRFAGKLATTIKDDPRTNRYYFRDLVAPRFFQVCLDDYVRAVSARDWESARAAYRGMQHFGRRRRYRPGWRMTVIRNPRMFRVMLKAHDRLPRGLRLTKNPVLRPN